MIKRTPFLLILAALLLGLQHVANGQVTKSDYARAESFIGWNAEKLITNLPGSINWIENDEQDRFWYKNRIEKGFEYVLVNPINQTKEQVFNHHDLAADLSEATDSSFVYYKLVLQDLKFEEGTEVFHFWLNENERWTYKRKTGELMGPVEIEKPLLEEVLSPNEEWLAYSKDENLWVRNKSTGEEKQLSTDGEEDFGYAVNPEGCCSEITNRRNNTKQKPILMWGADSKKIATLKLDERNVKELHLLETKEGRPELHSYKYALPGDSVIPKYELHIFDIHTGDQVSVKQDEQDMVNTSCCGIVANDKWKDVQWGENQEHFYFTSGDRTFNQFSLFEADVTTGETRNIITETNSTFVEFNLLSGGQPNWKVLKNGSEAIWFSERSGWGHLYLIDMNSGQVINSITDGSWSVLDVKHIDENAQWIYFTAMGKESNLNYYYRQFYRAKFDGSQIERLTSENTDHNINMAPSGNYFIDYASTREEAPIVTLRNPDGSDLLTLEKTNISRLQMEGWPFPQSIRVKARDGQTDLYGYVYKPSNFDSTKNYPVIDYIYPGPQIGSVGLRDFTVSPSGNAQALAELGFIVLQVDAFGSPFRSKKFHDFWYGNMGDNGIADHIHAIKQLSVDIPQIDLDKVGIFGHSGGGFSSTGAILRYPDFFKVAVSSAGNHDNRSYNYTWGEKYQGLLEESSDGSDNYDSQANHLLASELEGDLLLMYGTLDDNVHPNANLLLIDELIKHNKQFDLLVLPNRNHGFFNEPYVIKKRWDYFVKHLLEQEPPTDYKIEPPSTLN
ncbi:MAG: S9 family peptidase [Gracilimonas sp.]|uniref:S9 family peptidase n=1 Tax=Gracilimonas sp. TaxID=1974203 RepID=UPI00375242BD|nr:S9 family peptidase [Gracilimonas sp.]